MPEGESPFPAPDFEEPIKAERNAPPHPVEIEQKSEKKSLLNPEMTGVQALLLLEPSETIINASLYERDEHWNAPDSRHRDKTKEEKMADWENGMNLFLNKHKETEYAAFLTSIGVDFDQGAKGIYKMFIATDGEGKGDPTYYAKKVVDSCSQEMIEQHRKVIEELGNIYGANSAKIATLIAEGFKNKQEASDLFDTKAQEQINKGEQMPGLTIITTLQTQNALWRKKKGETGEETQPPPEPTPESEIARKIRKQADLFAERFKQLDVAADALLLRDNTKTFRPEYFKELAQQYVTPLAFVIKPTPIKDMMHAMLLLKEPYQDADGQWKIVFYDPLRGKLEKNISDYKKGENFTVDGESWEITANDKYYEKVTENPNFSLLEEDMENLPILQQHDANQDCVAYASYMAFLLNSRRKDLSDGEIDTFNNFQENLGIQIYPQMD